MLVHVSGNDHCFRCSCRNVRRFASRCSANVDNSVTALSVENVTDKLRSFILQIDQTLSGEFLQNPAGSLYPPGLRYELRRFEGCSGSAQFVKNLFALRRPGCKAKGNRRSLVVRACKAFSLGHTELAHPSLDQPARM